MTVPMQGAKETNADSDERDGSHGKRQLKSQINYCFICKKPQTKFARHLKRHAHQNADVAMALSLAPSSCERKKILEKLRNLGNFTHNTEVKATGSGALKVKRESKTSNVSETYDFCTHCKGMFSRRELWKHMKRCLLNSAMTEETSAGRTKITCLSKYGASESASQELLALIEKMHKNEVYDVIINDFFVLRFGKAMYNKHGLDKSKHDYIRQKLRELGRLLVTLRNMSTIDSVKEAVKPSNFMTLIKAVKKVAGLDEVTGIYKSPSLALKIGHSLRRVSELIMCQFLIDEDDEGVESIRRFHKLYDTQWSEFVSHSALTNLSDANYNKSTTIPLAEDVQRLHLHLHQEADLATKNLNSTQSTGSYTALAKITLCKVILFNRRRSGEVSKMTLKNFLDRDNSKTNDDISTGLNEIEKRMCQQLNRVELKGKRGRKVAVLLTPDMTASLTLLVSKRKECGVNDGNGYLFAIPHCQGFFRGQDCLRKNARASGAVNPCSLTSTNLRKHIATISQVMNLKDNELDQLANFLGHDIRVHREYYRLPQSTIQLAKISKLLIAMQGGSVKDIQGKSLDQIGGMYYI